MQTANTTAPDDSATPPRFTVQSAPADALAYVLSTWGRTIERDHLEAKAQSGFLKAFAPMQAKLIKRSEALLALDADGKIAAFAIYEPAGTIVASNGVELVANDGVLHWITTRPEQRQKGAARALVAASGLGKRPLITSWSSHLRYLGFAECAYFPFWLRS
jgi:hypothetical protein